MTLEIPGTAASMNSLDRVWEALDRGGFKPTRRANTFKALCPVHGDANPSLSVRYDPQAGKIALHCFGCEASVADITAQLSLTVSDLFDAPLPADRRTQNRSPRPKRPSLPPRLTREELATPAPDLTGASWQRVKAYEYVDDNGVVQQRVHREETVVDGVRHKRFTQSYRGANGRFVKRKPEGFAPLLYNLRAVTTTVADGGEVWLLEGEKDADNAIAQGLVATTNAGGATAFPAELVDRFRGGRVHLVVDNDHAGYKRAASVTAQLLNERIEARSYLPSLTERKADFTDHLEAGGTIDTLVEISVDDATALDAAAEAAKLLGQVEICLKEARAQLDASDQDRATAERNAEAWARESAQRLDRITSLQPTLADTLSERAEAARDELAATITAAAEISRDTFALAGLDIPQGVVAAIGTAPELEDTEPDVDERPARDPRTLTVTFQTGNGTGGGKGGSGSTGGGRPRFDGGDSGKRATIKREEYDVVDGITVSVKWAPADEAGEDGKTKWEPRYTAVLNGWAEIETVAVEDDGTDSEIARAPHMISIRFYRYIRDARGSAIVDEETGHPQIESTLVKFDEEQLRTGTWSQALPWPNLIESTTRRGKDQAWDAIRKARQTVASNSLVYTTLGWRTGADGQPFFVHSTGAIGQDGAIDNVEVKPSLFNVFALPAPSTDADELRAAWHKGTLEAKDSWLLGRALAPLLAQSWGSVLKPNDATVHLVGGRASLKSAHGRLAVQYFAPEVHYHGVKEMLSGSAKGGSALGLIRSANTVSHLPLLIDDFAPDGNAKQAQNRLGELARMRFNSTGRKVSTQRGGVREDRPIEANLITTGELTATGSADTRILNIPLHPQSVDKGKALFGRLESRSYRAARALLGSSLIHWVAQHRDQMLEEIQVAVEGDAPSPLATDSYWEQRLADLPHDSGVRNRLENIAVDLDRGIYIMLKMLREYGAITKEEAVEFYAWGRDGIYDAVALQDSASSDAGELLLGFLREALISGGAHLSTQHGDAPMDAASLGWVGQSAGEMPQWRPMGSRIGVIVGEGDAQRVYLIPSVAIGVANTVASRADEVFSETTHSIASSFESHGWLTKDHEGKRSGARRIGGQKIRVWDLPLHALLGADDEPGSGPTSDDPNSPDTNPGLFDTDPQSPTGPATDGTAPDVDEPPIEEPPADEYPPTDPYLDETPASDVSDTAADEPAASAEAEAPAAPAPAAATPAARTTPRSAFRASVAVLHTDGVWLPDGTRLDLDEQITHAGQVAMLASKLSLGTQINTGPSKLRRTERGQIYVTHDFALTLGIPFDKLPAPIAFRYREKLQEATAGTAFIADARTAGFQVSGKESLDPSIEVWHDNNPELGVLIGFLPALPPAFQQVILADDPTPLVVADRLQRFTTALRFPYRKTPSSTGLDLAFALHPRTERERLFDSCESPAVLREAGHSETDLDWQRTLTPDEQQHSWVHAYDRGGSYLAAVAGLEVGIGSPTHHPEPLPFTKLPGYWNITIPEDGHWLTPNLFSPRGLSGQATPGTRIWVATPTMELAVELGVEPEIHEAYLWHEKGRIFDTWQKRMREARQLLDTDNPDDQIARDLLKKVYVSGLGIMASDLHRNGRQGYAPHRYDHIIAKARANILRRVFQIGRDTNRWPVAISKDTLIYTSPDIDAVSSWPGRPEHYGRGLGSFKYEGTAALSEHAKYFTGQARPYEGKNDLGEIF
ncbi:CHC2 zinc finger domain-containing protein [Microbacterium sp. DT81.1]|uniref:CHC2 zinc finger domain-containing protein n=1 Tax=Microbacterium sp. DT81.1 TaxID=3393413 RepID=UPI003CFA1012